MRLQFLLSSSPICHCLACSISAPFFAKRVAMSCARNVPCDSVTGDESSRTNDNVTLLHRRDYNFGYVVGINWFKRDLVLLPWKGVRIIVVVIRVINAKANSEPRPWKRVLNSSGAMYFSIILSANLLRLLNRHTCVCVITRSARRKLGQTANGKYKNGDSDLLQLRGRN